MKIRDLQKQAKKEIKDENIAEKKELLKERIREITESERVLAELKTQYQDLLDAEV